MRAVGLVFWTQLRHRWRSWLAISILIGLVGGVIMAAAAAGRRTESAIPTFVADHGFDAEVYSTQSSPKIPRLPEVSAATVAFGPDNGQPACACRHPLNPSYFGVVVLPTKGRPAFNLVSGRLPDPSNPDEVVASYTLQQDEGVHLGSVFHVPFYAPSQLSAYNSATGAPPKPTGPTVALRVVGFEATEFDFPSGSTPSYSLYASQAFARTVLPHVATGYVYFVRLHRGAADLPRFDAATSALGTAYTQNEDAQVASVEASVHPQAIGWWLLAALAALVGLVVIGQALGRQSIAESADFPTMVALGVERRQLVMLGTARNLVVGLVGAFGAVLVATVLSPIAPLGEARVAESSTGINFDAFVLILGALATVVRCGRSRLLAGRAGGAYLPVRRPDPRCPALEVGRSLVVVRSTGERRDRRPQRHRAKKRRGHRAGGQCPGRHGVGGDRTLWDSGVRRQPLASHGHAQALRGPFPAQYLEPQQRWELPDPGLLQSLEHDPAVTGITKGIALPAISINKVVVGAIAGTAIKGHLLLSSVAGHTPDATGEIGLGATTMRQVGARLGSIVHVTVQLASGGRRTVPFRVVGQLSLPVLGNAVSLGSGAVFTLAGYEDAACPPGPQRAACRKAVLQSTNGGMLASVVPGPRGQAAINRYFERYRSLTALAVTPTSLINFGEAVNFPLIFGAILAVFGAATLLHLLVVSVSQRRREVGLLKVVGFVNGQVASTVAWQATTLAVAGIVIGVPTGVVVGGSIWRAFANNLGAVPVSVVPVWLIALLVAGVLVVANLIAVAPALVATRSKPRDLLRTI